MRHELNPPFPDMSIRAPGHTCFVRVTVQQHRVVEDVNDLGHAISSMRVDCNADSRVQLSFASARAAYNRSMSHKRYQFKLIEAADAAELETRLKEAGSQQWSAVGYGVLPDGRRSVLMERKTKVHQRKHHERHDQHREHDPVPTVAHDEKTSI
jgi:hypothetical protein